MPSKKYFHSQADFISNVAGNGKKARALSEGSVWVMVTGWVLELWNYLVWIKAFPFLSWSFFFILAEVITLHYHTVLYIYAYRMYKEVPL